MKADSKELFEKYNSGLCTEEEKAIVETALLSDKVEGNPPSKADIERVSYEVWNQIIYRKQTKGNTKLWPLIVTAAAIIALTIGTWLYFETPEIIKRSTFANVIEPGGNKATLTLANGKTINLSDAQTGVVINANKLTYSDGTVVANASENRYNGEGIQTISTPKGGQYEIVLSDSTKVFLNASTVLQFSANLRREHGQREVKLVSGEAYFEVFKDKKHPFIVKTKRQEVKVLGTHFNIEAYDIGDIKTTLLEGSVKVSSNLNSHTQSVLLKPGEQSKYLSGKLTQIPVDVNLVTAWKRGKIVFKDADLKSIMATLERWYNIEAVYQSYPSESRFSGSVSRSKNISEVLNLIESTQEVHFKIEGRRVLIMR